jgi:CRP-like cAMP-binding protein
VQWRRWVWFNVSMDVAPARVIRIVEETIQQTEISNVARNPLPNCVLMDVDDKGYARYALRYWLTDLTPDDPTDAAIRWHIMTALQRSDIRLAVGEHQIHMIKENEKHEEVIKLHEVALRMKTLKRVELFSQMTDDELRSLAERLKYAPFAKGSVIAKQGTVAHWLYIVITGSAEVYFETPTGEKRTVSELSKGSFFGEMGMMTGAPRSASVIAKTDVECYRLDKEMFEEILRARPAIAEEMSHILATRRAELDSVIQNLDAESAQKVISQRRSEILSTIRRFFGLTS